MIHLDLLTGAANALVEAIHKHDQQSVKAEAIRQPYEVARAIDSAYLAADRCLKALIAAVDPYLLLANPKRDLLRDIRGALMNREAPSIFTCGVRIDSLDAMEAVKLVPVIRPSLNPESYTTLVSALQTIERLRNHVQHGELYGDGDGLLAAVKSLLAELYVVATAIFPELLSRANHLYMQTGSRLKAYKADVDAAWQVVLDYLARTGTVSFKIDIYTHAIHSDAPLSVRIYGETLGDSIYASLDVPLSRSRGLFQKFLTEEEYKSRAFVRTLGRELQKLPVVRKVGKPAATIESAMMSGGLLGLEMPNVPKFLTPVEDGELHLDIAPGNLSLHLKGTSAQSYVFASVALIEWRLTARAGVPEIEIAGMLKSGRSGDSHAAEELAVRGTLQMDAEWVSSEPSEELELPAGTVTRSFSGTVTLSLASTAEQKVEASLESDESIG